MQVTGRDGLDLGPAQYEEHFVEEQGPDPGALATRVNARLEEALSALGGASTCDDVCQRANSSGGTSDWRCASAISTRTPPGATIGSPCAAPTVRWWASAAPSQENAPSSPYPAAKSNASTPCLK